jgi:hypothetical protein
MVELKQKFSFSYSRAKTKLFVSYFRKNLSKKTENFREMRFSKLSEFLLFAKLEKAIFHINTVRGPGSVSKKTENFREMRFSKFCEFLLFAKLEKAIFHKNTVRGPGSVRKALQNCKKKLQNRRQPTMPLHASENSAFKTRFCRQYARLLHAVIMAPNSGGRGELPILLSIPHPWLLQYLQCTVRSTIHLLY